MPSACGETCSFPLATKWLQQRGELQLPSCPPLGLPLAFPLPSASHRTLGRCPAPSGRHAALGLAAAGGCPRGISPASPLAPALGPRACWCGGELWDAGRGARAGEGHAVHRGFYGGYHCPGGGMHRIGGCMGVPVRWGGGMECIGGCIGAPVHCGEASSALGVV